MRSWHQLEQNNGTISGTREVHATYTRQHQKQQTYPVITLADWR
jgi:hypothetical protein